MGNATAEDLILDAHLAELRELCDELGMSIDEANDRAELAELSADEAAVWAQIECLLWLCEQ